MNPGLIIAPLFALSVLSIILVAWMQYRNAVPKLYVEGIGIKYGKGSVELPFPELEHALRAVHIHFQDKYPTMANELWKNVWVEIHPSDSVYFAQAHENGEYTRWSYFFGLKQGPRILVRQLRSYVHNQNGSSTMTGELLPADQSALFHEFCEHHLPKVVEGNVNFHCWFATDPANLSPEAEYARRFLKETYDVIEVFNRLTSAPRN